MNTALNHILQHQIVAIIRGLKPADVIRVAGSLLKGGVKTLEITLNSPGALKAIEELNAHYGNDLLIGAGTVLDASSAYAAISSGARFLISPCLNSGVIQTARRHGAISIPGAYTPTEIVDAYAQGADIVKVFPATIGPGYIKDIRGPLPHIPLMPTGGVQLNNIAEFKKAGAVAFGIGSALVNASKELNEVTLEELSQTARKFLQAVTN